MNSDLLTAMLKAASCGTHKKSVFTVNEGAQVSVLLNAGSGGPVPISRVGRISLGDAFVTLETKEDTYLLPYDLLVGVKLSDTSDKQSQRTGFHA